MPTDQQIDASAATADVKAEGTSSEITEDAIKAHPTFKELEQKYSAARTGMDQSNLTKKELQAEVARLRVMAGEEAKTEEPKEEETQVVTKQELQQQLWALQNAKDIELYGDEQYQKDVDGGIPRDYALGNAKLRFQSSPDKARLERQQQMASGSAASTRDISDADLEGFNQADADRWGYTKETWLKQKQLKKARG